MQQISFDQQLFTPSTAMNKQAAKQAGSLTEIIVDESSSLQAFHLIGLLSQSQNEDRWLMWLSPHKGANKHWFKSLGLANAPIVYVESNSSNQQELAEQILTAKTGHLIIEWVGQIDSQTKQHLGELAKASQTEVMLFIRRYHKA